MPATPVYEVETERGVARLHFDGGGPDLLVLGHGAGGGVEARDLLAARDAGLAGAMTVVRVEQPWRVRGRRIAEAPAKLDAAWRDALTWLAASGYGGGRRLVVGGRSAGARVACRTASEVGATAVLCLAFPLVPPGRPERSRGPELTLPGVPLLVVQGSRDAFGVPAGAVVIEGADHAFATRRGDPPAPPQVAQQVSAWLQTLT